MQNVIFYTLLVFLSLAIGLVGNGALVFFLPLLLFTGYGLKDAVAITLLVSVIPTNIISAWMYYEQSNINLLSIISIVIVMVIGSTIGAWIGSKNLVPERFIRYVYTLMVVCLAVYLVIKINDV